MSNFLPGGEIDYTECPDVIRLFMRTNSHPENIAAFQAKQNAKRAAWEESRKLYRKEHPHITKEELKRMELKVIDGNKS